MYYPDWDTLKTQKGEALIIVLRRLAQDCCGQTGCTVTLLLTHFPLSTLAILKSNPHTLAKMSLFKSNFRSDHTLLTTLLGFISRKIKANVLPRSFTICSPVALQP